MRGGGPDLRGGLNGKCVHLYPWRGEVRREGGGGRGEGGGGRGEGGGGRGEGGGEEREQ